MTTIGATNTSVTLTMAFRCQGNKSGDFFDLVFKRNQDNKMPLGIQSAMIDSDAGKSIPDAKKLLQGFNGVESPFFIIQFIVPFGVMTSVGKP